MLTVLPCKKIVSDIFVIAFVVSSIGPSHCNAFSVVEQFVARSRLSSTPMTAAFRPSNSIPLMATSAEKEETMTTIAGGNDGSAQPYLWKTYDTMMENMIRSKRVKKRTKCDDKSISKCCAFLLSHEQDLSPVPDFTKLVGSDKDEKKDMLISSLKNQANHFRQRFNFTDSEVEIISRSLAYIGDDCARIISRKKRDKDAGGIDSSDGDDPRLSIVRAWHKTKEIGHILQENSMSTYMFILSNSGEGNKEIDALVDDALLEVISCYHTMYESNEKTVTIRLKSLMSRGKVVEAEDMLKALAAQTEISGKHDKAVVRLRTYMPLMEHYCAIGNLTSTMRLYRQMQACPGIHWDVESYSLLLSSLARFGYFFGDDKNETSGNKFDRSDDVNLYGPILFDSLVSDMAKDILELTEETSSEIIDSFQIGMKAYFDKQSKFDDSGKDQVLSSQNYIVERVKIPKGNGTCPVTGVKLRLLALDEFQRQNVHDTLLKMSQSTTEEWMASIQARNQKESNEKKEGNTESIQDENYGYQELLKFSKWLDDREGNLFTAIVDGANVAYYGHKDVHYSTLKKVVEKLQVMGERPLVVMPKKYTLKSFACKPKYYQELTQKDQEVIDWLQENDMMYIVPRLNLDDYFWMLASVSNQTKSSQRDDLRIPVGNDQGRFPGMRPMLITNDQMRDHKLDLLEPREFRRWSSCHIVNYKIPAYEEDEWEEDRKITFLPADYFSREIQSNPCQAEEKRVWHFPIGNSTDWLCVSINR